jgi:hypothetical protein
MNPILAKIAVILLPILINNITPELKKLLLNFLNELEIKAKATASPYDDMLVKFLKAFVD